MIHYATLFEKSENFCKEYKKMIKILIKKLSIFCRGSIWKSKPAFSLIHVVKIRKIFNFLALGLTLFGPLFFLFFIKNFLWFFSKNTRYSPWYNILHYLKKSENFCKNLVKNKNICCQFCKMCTLWTHMCTPVFALDFCIFCRPIFVDFHPVQKIFRIFIF